jgi:PLP dependent protein
MSINTTQYEAIINTLSGSATLVAVSKTKPASDIEALYALGQRDFGENYVQELTEKATLLPPDIRWHFIGHLQSNKVKYIAPFVHLIHGVDSIGLLNTIHKQALKNNRVIDCLLQIHIAREETKFGLDENELHELLMTLHSAPLTGIRLRGLMGMASFSQDEALVRQEFTGLKQLYDTIKINPIYALPHFDTLSMGMSGDYPLAIAAGSNMVRIGSLLFGARG